MGAAKENTKERNERSVRRPSKGCRPRLLVYNTKSNSLSSQQFGSKTSPYTNKHTF